MKKAINCETINIGKTDFAAGFAVGKLLEIVAIEGYAHQVLAHRNAEYHPVLEAMSRYALIAFGMSPNRFAARHRVHHAQQEISPSESLVNTVRNVLTKGAGSHIDPEEARSHLLFPGHTFDEDPLIKEKDDKLTFRTDPPLEQFVAGGGVRRVVPAAALLVGGALINKAAGRKHPLQRSLASMAGVATGLTVQSVMTAYAESRVGIVDGHVETQRAGLLRKELERHEEHHAKPWDLSAGHARRHRVGFKALLGLGLAKELKS